MFNKRLSWSWSLDLQLPMQSVPITTKVVSSNPTHGEVYLMQHNGIKFINDLQQVSGFLHVLRSIYKYLNFNWRNIHNINSYFSKPI
jgi:hypothetical protein